MPQATATITNVAQAFEVIKEMNLHGYRMEFGLSLSRQNGFEDDS